LLTEPGLPDAYVEVKCVTMRRHGDLAEFPDSVTKRGAKHLKELAEMVLAGHRAVLFYVVHRTDCARVGVAGDIDATYHEAYRLARQSGVQIIAYDTAISTDGETIRRSLPVLD